MAYDLYQLQSGRLKRRNEQGLRQRYEKGYNYVPTPGELSVIKANPVRAIKIGTVPDDAPEVKLMLKNLNTTDYPQGLTQQGNARVTDIREVKATADAVAFISTVESEDELDNFLVQEADNKPRVRKAVLNAIEGRRALLTKKNSLAEQLNVGMDSE